MRKPDWMNTSLSFLFLFFSLSFFIKAYLQSQLTKEREEPDFQPFPPHFLEVAHLLFTHCLEDVAEGEELRVLLEDIEGLRLEKVRSGISVVGGPSLHTQTDTRVYYCLSLYV